MPTIKYSVNEVTDIIKRIAEDSAENLRVNTPKGLRVDLSWIHKDDDRNDSRNSKDFSPYDSCIEVTFTERF
jgi:hypothetical protein